MMCALIAEQLENNEQDVGLMAQVMPATEFLIVVV
jgi:hypothetical protein